MTTGQSLLWNKHGGIIEHYELSDTVHGPSVCTDRLDIRWFDSAAEQWQWWRDGCHWSRLGHRRTEREREMEREIGLDWIEQCFTSPPTQCMLYGRLFLQVKRPNQQYQSTEGTNSTQTDQTYNKQTWTQNTTSPLVCNSMGWLGDGSHGGQGCQAWTAVGPPPRYPHYQKWPVLHSQPITWLILTKLNYNKQQYTNDD